MFRYDGTKFRLKRYFSVASGMLMLAVVLPLSYAYYHSEVKEHTSLTGSRNEMLARTYANALWPEFGEFLMRQDMSVEERRVHPTTKLLDERIREMSSQVPIIKIKVYNSRGVAVYSPLDREIGEDKSRYEGFVEASRGHLVNELDHREKMNTARGEIRNVDVVSTYIPIRLGNPGDGMAVFELYSDMTDVIKNIKKVSLQLLGGLVAVFALLYLSLLAIVARADRIIERQYLELEEGQSQLQAKAAELETEIQERIEMENALRRSEEVAANASKAKSEFLSSMSHELRTPMNAILGFTQLLETEPDARLSDNQIRFIQQIMKAGAHLLGLIDQVLDLARIEAGKLSVSIEPVEARPLIEESLGMVQHLMGRKGITAANEVMPNLRVDADYGRLRQVVLNLLSNAVKYNRDGGQVGIRSELLPQGQARIFVSDTGNGIPAGRMDELFKPFSRLAREGGDIEGTGIGLALSKRIIEAMGGEIGVESEEGKGCTFWVQLPTSSPKVFEAQSVLLADGGSRQPEESDAAGVHTVLYVEDNPANLMLMEELIRRMQGVRLISAHTSELGIALAQQEHPQLIIMDINLPGMDGFQALSILKQDLATQDIPVMALSANAMKSDVSRGLAAGFREYHTKPVNVDVLTRSIRAALGLEQA